MRSAFSMFSTSLLALGVLAWSGADSVAAQTVPIDEGTFDVTLDGQAAGTESFSIRRSGGATDGVVIATAEITLDAPEGRLDLRPALQASGGDMAVSAYQIKTSGHIQEEVILRPSDDRYVIRVRSELGDRERELRAPEGTILLDTNVAHQYYFLASRLPSSGGTLPVIVPRQGIQFDMEVTEVGPETITVGGSPVQSRHLRLEGSGATTELWIDQEGRILRVERPGYTAERTSLP